MNFYLRGFVYPEYLIIIEVTLFDAPAIESDFTFKSGTQAENNPAFRLCHHAVWIDHSATVYGCDHPMHPYPAFFSDKDFRPVIISTRIPPF